MKTTQISVAIVDDHYAIRDFLTASFMRFKYVKNAESFANSKELFEKMNKHSFDLVILDIRLKDEEDGLDICKAIKNKFKQVKVLMYSQFNSPDFIIEAYQNNADGYLCKDAGKEELVLAVEKIILKNEKYFSPEVLDYLFQLNETKKKKQEKLSKLFTARELEVMKLIKAGKSNLQISGMFNRSIRTVIKHRYNILRKIHGHKSLDIFLYAIKNGELFSYNRRMKIDKSIRELL